MFLYKELNKRFYIKLLKRYNNNNNNNIIVYKLLKSIYSLK